jgi:3-methyladenine DNA glycosylase Tag
MEGEWKPPEWWYRKQRPASDEAYFENMSRVIFQAGLNWNVIGKKWLTTKTAFSQFSIGEVACFTDSDVARLLKDAGIVRNKSKVCATIQNAAEFQNIKKQCGSFKVYLDSLDKSKNYAKPSTSFLSGSNGWVRHRRACSCTRWEKKSSRGTCRTKLQGLKKCGSELTSS